MLTYEIVNEPVEGVEITWRGTYYETPFRTATYFEPAEGGIELECDVHPITVTYYPREGEEVTIDNIQNGSILAHLLVAKYGTPSEEDQYDAAGSASYDRHENTRE